MGLRIESSLDRVTQLDISPDLALAHVHLRIMNPGQGSIHAEHPLLGHGATTNLAMGPDCTILVSDGEKVIQFDRNGEQCILLSIPDIAESLGEKPGALRFARPLCYDANRNTLCCGVWKPYSRSRPVEWGRVCQYQLGAGTLTSVPFCASAVVDVHDGVVYDPQPQRDAPGRSLVRMTPIDDVSAIRECSVSRPFHACAIDAERRNLLLWGDLAEQQLSILDLDSESETILPISGLAAGWGTHGTVLGGRPSMDLYWWTPEGDITQLFQLSGSRMRGEGGYDVAPVLSSDGRWLYWKYQMAHEQQSDEHSLGTILADLHRREYQVLDVAYRSALWLQ